MIQFLPEMRNGRPDEFDVMVVRDGIWQRYGTYESRQKASEALDSLDRHKYKAAGIKPQISSLRPFQTHPLEEIWNDCYR